MNLLKEWADHCESLLPGINEFEKGFYAALILTGAVLVLLLCLYLIFKIKRGRPVLPGVTLEREDGDIFIARSALAQAVLHLGDEFPGMEIQKVILRKLRSGDGLELAVSLMFDERRGVFDVTVKAFKARVFQLLHDTFGVESVKAVAVALIRLPDRERGDGGANDRFDSAVMPGF